MLLCTSWRRPWELGDSARVNITERWWDDRQLRLDRLYSAAPLRNEILKKIPRTWAGKNKMAAGHFWHLDCFRHALMLQIFPCGVDRTICIDSIFHPLLLLGFSLCVVKLKSERTWSRCHGATTHVALLPTRPCSAVEGSRAAGSSSVAPASSSAPPEILQLCTPDEPRR